MANRENEKNLLEFHCRLLKLKSEKAKARLDDIIASVQGKVIPLDIMPEDIFWQELPNAKMLLQEAQNMIDGLTEVMNRFACELTLESSPVLAACDPTELYQPCDFLPRFENENNEMNNIGTPSLPWLYEFSPRTMHDDSQGDAEFLVNLKTNEINDLTVDLQREKHDHLQGSAEYLATLKTNEDQSLTANVQREMHDNSQGRGELLATLKTKEDQSLTADVQREMHDSSQGRGELFATLKTKEDQNLTADDQIAIHANAQGSVEFLATLKTNDIQVLTADAEEEIHDHSQGGGESLANLKTKEDQNLTTDVQRGMHDNSLGSGELLATLKTKEDQNLMADFQKEMHDNSQGRGELLATLRTKEDQNLTADVQKAILANSQGSVEFFATLKTNDLQVLTADAEEEIHDHSQGMNILDDKADVDLNYETNLELKDPPLGSVLNIYLSYWKPPNLVWIQLDGREVQEMNEKLQSLCFVPLAEVHVGMKVVAFSGLDGLYYRAVVKKCTVDSEDVEVVFVDYGNKKTVKKKCLFPLPLSCSGIPYMATACIVTQVNGKNWIEAAEGRDSELFCQLMTYVRSDSPLQAVLKKVLPAFNEEWAEYVDIPRYFVSFFTPEVPFIPLEDEPYQGPQDLEFKIATSDEMKIATCDEIKIATCDELSSTVALDSDPKDSASGSKADGKNDCPLINWEPLPEEEMRNSESIEGHWTSLLAPVTKVTDVYTIDAERKVVRTKKHVPISLKTHVWDDDCHFPGAIGNIDDSTLDLEDKSTFVPKKPQIELGFELQPVSLIYVVNPQKFYLRLDDSNIELERLQSAMQDYYQNEDRNPVKEGEFPIGSYWAVRSKDGKWYRAVVILNSDTSDLEITKTYRKLRVHYIDYGSEEDVDVSHVQALTEDFCEMHSLAIPCCLYQVYPNHAWGSNPWPQENTEAFVRQCFGLGASMFAQFRFLDISDTYKVILFNCNKVNINEFMVFSGYAVSAVMSKSKSDNGDSSKQTVDESAVAALPTGWNPMAADFLATGNTKVDDECAEIVLAGLKNTDKTRICRFYHGGKTCPRGVVCPFEHSRPRDGVTTEKTVVFHSSSDCIELPAVGDVVAVIVTACVSPSLFYVYLPYGNKDLREFQIECEAAGNESLEKLCSAMYDYYHSTLPEPDLVLPAPGEIKVVFELDSGSMVFRRARVLDTKKEDETTLIQVFYIDSGDKAWIKEEQLRHVAPQFVHLPAQAIECYLENVERPEGGWSALITERLQELLKGVTLVAEITSVDIVQNRLGVVLYNTDEGDDMNINETLKIIMNEEDVTRK